MMDFHHIMMLIHHKLYDSYKLYYCRGAQCLLFPEADTGPSDAGTLQHLIISKFCKKGKFWCWQYLHLSHLVIYTKTLHKDINLNPSPRFDNDLSRMKTTPFLILDNGQ